MDRLILFTIQKMCEDFNWRFNSSKTQINNGTISIIANNLIYEISCTYQLRWRKIDIKPNPWYPSYVGIIKECNDYMDAIKVLYKKIGEGVKDTPSYTIKYNQLIINEGKMIKSEFKFLHFDTLEDAKKKFKEMKKLNIRKCLMLIEHYNNKNRLVDVINNYVSKEQMLEEINNCPSKRKENKMSITVTKEEVYAKMNTLDSTVLKENQKDHPCYEMAKRKYRSIYNDLRNEKLKEIKNTKKEFFMEYLYPSLKEFLKAFGISDTYIGYKNYTYKRYNNVLAFERGGREIITCVLQNVIIPALEKKGVKGIKLNKKWITGNESTDIFDYSELEFIPQENND